MAWAKVLTEKGDAVAINPARVQYLKALRNDQTRVFFAENDNITVDITMSDLLAKLED